MTKFRTKGRLSLFLAGLLPFMPLLRAVLPSLEFEAPVSGSIILKWIVGGIICGYDAISSASSIAISPPSAIIGVPYSGTITYSGGHAGSVSSMSVSGTCLGTYTLATGLSVHYNGVNTASVSGTPTGSIGTIPFTVTVYDASGCGGGLSDTRSTSFIVQNTNGGPVAPSMTVVPQNTVAQVGSSVILSGGASGNPPPTYFWKLGTTAIPGATQNTLTLPTAQLTNGGVYTLYASNSQGTANSACYLTMAQTPGSNILALLFTNYAKAGIAVTMSSYITNVPSGANSYSWQYNNTSIGVTTSNLSLTGTQTIPTKSGTYSVTFTSSISGTNVVNSEQYNSYWVFGYAPTISTNPPATQNVSSGGTATFPFTMVGGNYPTASLYLNGTTLVAQTNLPAYNPNLATSATNLSFSLANVNSGNSGTYTVVITNYWGSITSSASVLTVGSPLSVTAPQGQTNYAGKTVSMSVTASGTAPYFYHWQKSGVNLSNGGGYSGATTNTLTISPATTNHSGNYQIVVTNNSGNSVTSSVAAVSIVPVPALGASMNGIKLILTAGGGVVGSNYVVEATTNLANTNSWIPLLTNPVPTGGSIGYTNTNTASPASRFYRVQFP